MAVYLYALPQDDALLTAVGGVTPLVTFHRGDCTVAPENTLPAFGRPSSRAATASSWMCR